MFRIKLISFGPARKMIDMAEPFIETIWAMAGVFAVFVAVVFGVRGGGHKSTEHTPEGT